MSTTSAGRYAEEKAAAYLKLRGFKLVEKNWRNRYCEIDLIVEKDKLLSFVEVKYRSSVNWGGGWSAIDSRKLDRMVRAAEYYVSHQGWREAYQLIAAIIDDQQIEIVELYGV